MPLLSIIGGALLYFAGNLVARVLVALGVAAITFVGMNTFMDGVKAYMLTNIHELPPQMIAVVAMLKIGVCLNIIISAGLMRLTMQGLSSGGSLSKVFLGSKSV